MFYFSTRTFLNCSPQEMMSQILKILSEFTKILLCVALGLRKEFGKIHFSVMCTGKEITSFNG